ncbi:TonB family protein [Thermodesulfobacteriota bacterium]
MDTLKNPNINFPVMSAFGAVIFTVMLLIIISTLSKFYIPPDEIVDSPPPISIDDPEPPKPLDPFDEVTDQAPIPRMKPDMVNDTPDPPETVGPRPDFRVEGPGTRIIPNIRVVEQIKIPAITDIFPGFQVDQQPVITRMVKPIYPFSAKSSGIEGRVILRFIVDEKGIVQKPEVLEAEPEGVFEDAALAAVVKYRFKPAKIDNRPVKCIVKMPISFTLTE